MIKAFRDTWELGIHSYLSYLRDRLLLTRDLLADSGSVFVQISDENVHYVRQLCDEVFGRNNECATIVWKKGTPTAKIIRNSFNYLLWYAKDAEKVGNKVHKLYTERSGIEGSTEDPKKLALWGDFEHGETRPLTTDEKRAILATSQIANIFRVDKAIERGDDPERKFSISLDGTCFTPKEGYVWRGKYDQIQRLIEKNRLIKTNEGYEYKFYISDFPAIEITNLWEDTAGKVPNMIYAVQTNEKIIQRCMLITTDPGDLVLDITCGSGTTAFVAEQWGRRWITCDTSRVAIAIAKQRLMTATFDYYKLAHEEQGVGSGFVYKTVPHITLKSIANNEPPANEILYDQPEIDKGKVRITGPFTVEALPAPVVKPLDDIGDIEEDFSAKQTDWRDQLLATGVLGRGGSRLTFSRVEPLSGTKFLQAEAETKEDLPRRAVICFAGETKPLDSRMVAMAMDEVERLRPAPKLVIFAAFQFDPEAAKDIDEYIYPGVTVLKAQMNTDLMTEDLKKERSSDQSFWLVGQPDVELIRDGRSKRKFKVKVNGFDYYDVKKGTVESGSTSRIAMWMLDTDYDGMCIEPKQVFFPMGGKKDGWNKLAKTLRAEIDPDLIEKYAGNESLWFMAEPNTRIAVKIIDDRGIESLKVIRIGDE
jgi:DNA methylase N-4/N-6 domain protein